MMCRKIGRFGISAWAVAVAVAAAPLVAQADNNIQGNNGNNSPCCIGKDNSENNLGNQGVVQHDNSQANTAQQGVAQRDNSQASTGQQGIAQRDNSQGSTGQQGVAQRDNSVAATGNDSQAVHDNSAAANGAGASALNNLNNNALAGSGGQAFQQAHDIAAVAGTGSQGFENANNFSAANGTAAQAFDNVHDFAASSDHSVSLNNTQPNTVIGLSTGTAVTSTVLASSVSGTFTLGGASGLASSGPPVISNAIGANAFNAAAGITQVAQTISGANVQQNVTMQANLPSLSTVTTGRLQ